MGKNTSQAIDLSAVALSRRATDDLRKIVNGINPKIPNSDMLPAALAAMTSLHMTGAIASALSKGKPIDAGMLGSSLLTGDTANLFFQGGSSFGFFMENITGGPESWADRRKPTADQAFSKAYDQLSAVTDKVIDEEWEAMNKMASPTVKKFSFTKITKWLKEFGGNIGDSGFEQKTYESTLWGLHVGGTGEISVTSKEELLVEAIKKLYTKMNTLYLMSTQAHYSGEGKAVVILAADLFHELVFDEVIKKVASGLISVKIEGSKERVMSRVQAIAKDTFNIGAISYKISIDYRKLDEFISAIAEDVKQSIESQTQGALMGKTGLYAQHWNLYPGAEQKNFFDDVLDYIYAKFKIFSIIKP